MYGWLWRHLPGPTPARVAVVALAIAVVVVALFGWVFPLVDATGWFDNGAVSS